MARQLRIEFPGAVYHLMSRGDRREAIFKNDEDRSMFLGCLGEVCGKTDWRVHAYCLMENHFHLVVETPRGDLAAGMKWFMGVYTSRFNRCHGVTGHLFSGRYKSILIGAGSPGYLRTVCEYVHLNPSRAQMLRKEEPLKNFRWSSFPVFLELPAKRPVWLNLERLFGDLGIPKDSPAGRREFESLMERRRVAEDVGTYSRIRRGWCLGDEAFKKELLDSGGKGATGDASHLDSGESSEAKARRLLEAGLQRLGWKPSDLIHRAKGDPGKVRLAIDVRRGTTVPLRWIAENLHMGTCASLSNLLSKHRNGVSVS